QLLPQAVAVLAGELGRELVDPAEPADRDEEGLVWRQTGCLELRHLLAQVCLQFVGVTLIDRAPAHDRRTPLLDTCLKLFHRHTPVAGIAKPQSPPSVRVAVTHWRRCS